MIQTFIFLDLETTGFISRNRDMPRITELSLIAVSNNAICSAQDILPRVLHKLVLPINPNVLINKRVESLTGLSNQNLESVQCFNEETYHLMTSFIKKLAGPICFVAYNGNRFDYPILLWELLRINQVFSEDVLSIDMYHCITDFFSNKETLIQQECIAETATSISCSTPDFSNLLNDGCDTILLKVQEEFTVSLNMKSHDKNKTSVLENDEPTPCSSHSILDTPQTDYCNKMQEANEKTPENQIIKSAECKRLNKWKPNSTKRKLNFTNGKLNNFKLPTVYKYFFETDLPNAHSAEGDCLAMLSCAIEIEKFFIPWANNHAVPINRYI